MSHEHSSHNHDTPEAKDRAAAGEVSPASAKHHHRESASVSLELIVITVSDTRTLETDTGGALVAEMLDKAGHKLSARNIVPDEPAAIEAAAREALATAGVAAVILTGGTGVAPRDVTPESVEPLLERIIPGFGELFRQLSYQDIGSAALLSRATAGLAHGKVVFVIPGSRGAVRLAMEKLILPELGHLVAEAVKTR
jgi:molybdenum cofactor biosynthesis protein B